MRTAKYRPSKTANEHVERNWRYRGTLNLESLKRDASRGSYKEADLRTEMVTGSR